MANLISRRSLLESAGILTVTALPCLSYGKTGNMTGGKIADRVTVPPGFYTLAEVAKLLSSGTDSIRCSSAIQGRAVLLALVDRPYNEARRVLCETLGLRITPIDNTTYRWLMEVDPAVAQREKAWRDAYADRAAVSLTAYLSSVTKCLGDRTYKQWRAESEAQGRTPPDFSDQISPSTGEKISAEQAHKKHQEWHRKRLFLDVALQPGFWLGSHRLQRHPPDLRRTIRSSARSSGTEVMRLSPFSPKFGIDGVPGEQFSSAESAKWHDTLAERTVFDPVQQALIYQTATFFYAEADVSNAFMFPCATETLESLFSGLGEDAAAYLVRSRKQTEAFFDMPEVRRAVRLPDGDGESLSASLLAWCRAIGAEVVAEVQPLRDECSAVGTGHSLRLSDLTPKARAVAARGVTAHAAMQTNGFLSDKVVEAMAADDSIWPLPPSVSAIEAETPDDLMYWDFHLSDDGILRVSDRMAFLDRGYELPMYFPLALWRLREAHRADSNAPETLPEAPFAWEELYPTLLSPAAWDTTCWVRLGLATQWAFPIGRISKIVPFLHLLSHAGLGSTGTVKEKLEAKGRLVIPVAACGPNAGAQIGDALRRQGFWCANAYHSRFDEFAEKCHLVLLRDKTPVPDYGDESPPPGTPRVAANILTVDLHDMTQMGTRWEWDMDSPDLTGYWFIPRDLPCLEWAG